MNLFPASGCRFCLGEGLLGVNEILFHRTAIIPPSTKMIRSNNLELISVLLELAPADTQVRAFKNARLKIGA
jgi:hypothetical protein